MDLDLFSYNILHCFCRDLLAVLKIFLYYSLLSSHNLDWYHITLCANSLDDMSLPTNISLCLFVILSPSCCLIYIIFLSCHYTCNPHNINWSHIIVCANTYNNMCLPTDFSLCLFMILSPSCSLASIMFLSCQHICSSYNFHWSYIAFWANIMNHICYPTVIYLFIFFMFVCDPITFMQADFFHIFVISA